MKKLAPPGAGLPLPELLIARLRFRIKCARTSDRDAIAEFQQCQSLILAACEQFPPEQAAQQALIRRLRGLEDSSRNWSIYMTVDHLRIVNDVIASTCELLAKGGTPEGQLGTADVKPSPGTTQAVLALFDDSCKSFVKKMSAIDHLKTAVKFRHPWFGEMDGSRWLVLAAFHMRLHLAQIHRIGKSLG